MSERAKQQSNPFSTGGGGVIFETRIQAAFAVLMLTGRIAPCLPPWPITKLKLQGHFAGFHTDDCIIFTNDSRTEREAKLLVQIKHSISITEGNSTFGEVIQAAWNDFKNSSIMNIEMDSFALITGPLSAIEINNTRTILEWARHSEDEKEFLHKVNIAHYSNDAKRTKLNAFKVHLKNANGGIDISDEHLWLFLKSFYLFGYDLDTESGSTLSLLQSLIAQSSKENPSSLWASIVDFVQSCNQNAGTITIDNMPEDIRKAFNVLQASDWYSDVKKLIEHGDYIINGISTNIGGVHIKRKTAFDQLLEVSEEAEFVFLSGERGCGKSCLVRQFAEYMKERVPVFCLRIEDLDKSHLDNVFSAIGLSSSLSTLEAGFAMMPKKYLLIESFEKLLELNNTAAFSDLMQFVRMHTGWTIIASGRDYAYQQINFNYLRPTGVHISSLFINNFNEEDIQFLCDKLESLRPLYGNQTLRPLLMNPFIADLAYKVVETGTRFSSSDGEKEFRAAVWRDIISKEHIRVEGMPLRRRQTFISIALRRSKQMVYGVPEKEFDSMALLRLEEDSLIRRDLSKGLVSIAHDVLEDWALERYIEEAFQDSSCTVAFLDSVGHEPAINRAFRLWLHQKMKFGENVTALVLDILKSREIERCWQDETISAVLLGNNPTEFLSRLKDHFIDNNSELLKRFCFILRVSCKIPDQDLINQLSGEKNVEVLKNIFLKPYGPGWEALINFLFDNKDIVSKDILAHITAVLYDWSSIIHIERELPVLARKVGLLSIHLLNMLKESYRDEGNRKKLLSIIIKVVPAIQNEFNEILEADVFISEKKGRRLPYVKDFCAMSLLGIETVFLCKHVPDTVIKLAFYEWLIDGSHHDYYQKVEESFGLHRYRLSGVNFFPASGAKGPFQHLLRFHTRKGLDFIIELLNISAKKYAHSDLDSPKRYSSLPIDIIGSGIEQVNIRLIDGTSVKQYCSGRLWVGYRGHSVIPSLLQSALMALENWLISCIEYASIEKVEWLFDYILRNSNSVMPTAVLASVATGFPDKVGKAAFPLLQTSELYDLDLNRTVRERGGNEINWHKTGLNSDLLGDMYTEERRTAALQPWRQEHLETLIVRLQFTHLRDKVLAILDDLRSKAPNNEKWRFRFHRIDSREWEPKLDEDNNRIIFTNRNLDPDLENIQQKTQEKQALNNRFFTLFLWSEKTFNNEELDREYYTSIDEALIEAKSLFQLIMSGAAGELTQMHYGGIVKAAAVFLRDYSSEMKEDDFSWCAELVVQAVMENADTDEMTAIVDITDYDGAAAAASVIPLILDYAEGENEKLIVKKIIATALTHANGTVRKEAANGVRAHLWQREPDFARKCIIGAIEYARLIREIRGTHQASTHADGQSSEWLEQFREKLSRGEAPLIQIDQVSFHSHSSWHLLSPCIMIPDGSTESIHVSLLSRVLTLIIKAEESEKTNRYGNEKKISIDHELPMNFAQRLADYLQGLSEEDINPFIEKLRTGCDLAPDFIHLLLICMAASSERMGNKELYWRLWKHLSDKVQSIAISIAHEHDRNYRYEDDRIKLIRGMLHADTPWQKVDYENQDIALGKDLILEFVSNAGFNADVFEAMASLMYHFPVIFFKSGLLLLSKFKKEIGETKLFSRVNTTFYLERCINRFLLQDNTGPLSKELHHSCHVLLDALVETASCGAYYLRENLIRSQRIA